MNDSLVLHPAAVKMIAFSTTCSTHGVSICIQLHIGPAHSMHRGSSGTAALGLLGPSALRSSWFQVRRDCGTKGSLDWRSNARTHLIWKALRPYGPLETHRHTHALFCYFISSQFAQSCKHIVAISSQTYEHHKFTTAFDIIDVTTNRYKHTCPSTGTHAYRHVRTYVYIRVEESRVQLQILFVVYLCRNTRMHVEYD